MIRKIKRRFEQWRAGKSNKTFQEYYVEQTTRMLNKDFAHPTLGKHHGGKHLCGGDLSQAGRSALAWLKRSGLEPHHVCVDYGCGTLRVGQHLIEYLDPGKYWGVDITDRFLDAGREWVETSLLTQKEPHFGVIDDETLGAIRMVGADYVFSIGVLQHVPPEELDAYFSRLLMITGKGTQTLIKGRLAESSTQLTWSTWLHSLAHLHESAHRCGGVVEVLNETPKWLEKEGVHCSTTLFRLRAVDPA